MSNTKPATREEAIGSAELLLEDEVYLHFLEVRLQEGAALCSSLGGYADELEDKRLS